MVLAQGNDRTITSLTGRPKPRGTACALDSVREPTAADKKALGSKCHGKVCTIKCVDTGKTRVVNTQDAFQVKRTVEAQHEFMKKRRASKRTAKGKASKKA